MRRGSRFGVTDSVPLALPASSDHPQKNRLPLLVKRLSCEARRTGLFAVTSIHYFAGFGELFDDVLERVSGALAPVELYRVRQSLQLVPAFLSFRLEDSQQALTVLGLRDSGQGLVVLFGHCHWLLASS